MKIIENQREMKIIEDRWKPVQNKKSIQISENQTRCTLLKICEKHWKSIKTNGKNKNQCILMKIIDKQLVKLYENQWHSVQIGEN